MFSRFLQEGAEITGDSRLAERAEEFRHIGDEWEKLGSWFQAASEAAEPTEILREFVAPLDHLADIEETAWQNLQDIVQD
jgi:hypothetical protein